MLRYQARGLPVLLSWPRALLSGLVVVARAGVGLERRVGRDAVDGLQARDALLHPDGCPPLLLVLSN